jgi:hypothetical protein
MDALVKENFEQRRFELPITDDAFAAPTTGSRMGVCL